MEFVSTSAMYFAAGVSLNPPQNSTEQKDSEFADELEKSLIDEIREKGLTQYAEEATQRKKEQMRQGILERMGLIPSCINNDL
ncbi:MAG: hypothetical protein JKY27_06165 [Magnetovibrio sp.]|nr:hypothetical protein [Magnetovibrio sp.]